MCPFCVDTNGGFWRYNSVDFYFKVERNVGSAAVIGIKARPPTPPIWASTNFCHVQHTMLIVLLDSLTNMKIWTG
jgi:hypothetical protein